MLCPRSAFQQSGPHSGGNAHLPTMAWKELDLLENMRKLNCLPSLWLSLAASSLVVFPVLRAEAQTPAKPAQESAPAGDRSAAYFHASLANMYEEQAINSGRPEFVQHAI